MTVSTNQPMEIAVPFHFDGAGRVAVERRVERQAEGRILGLIGTARGERVMRSELGTDVPTSVFESNTPALAAALANDIRETINAYEPNIDVLFVDIEQGDPTSGSLAVSVSYSVADRVIDSVVDHTARIEVGGAVTEEERYA